MMRRIPAVLGLLAGLMLGPQAKKPINLRGIYSRAKQPAGRSRYLPHNGRRKAAREMAKRSASRQGLRGAEARVFINRMVGIAQDISINGSAL